jgi:hypothetical protein
MGAVSRIVLCIAFEIGLFTPTTITAVKHFFRTREGPWNQGPIGAGSTEPQAMFPWISLRAAGLCRTV